MHKILHTLIALILLSSHVQAKTVIGIMDSGFDLTHDWLTEKVYENPHEIMNGLDDDRNGAIDDIYGWNLLDNNNVLFDDSLRGKFPPEVYKYYRLRAKKSLGTITSKELKWYEEKLKDPEFKKSREGFTSFIHGTHVTGVATSAEGIYSKYEILFRPVRYLGNREDGNWIEPEFTPDPNLTGTKAINHIKDHMRKYTRWQMKKLEAGIRLSSHKVQIINGSFGKSFKSLMKSAEILYEKQFSKMPNKEIQTELALYFGNDLCNKTEQVLKRFQKILFTFSAGNSKDDNDIRPHYPSNARLENVIAVGASKGHEQRAYFSNFGKKTVDIFAPGLAIESSIPGDVQYDDRTLQVNGTSQASPYIANLAAKMLEKALKLKVNLKTSDIKKIIIETVDKKASMANDSVSGGIVNPDRALFAVTLARKLSLVESIKAAREKVDDINPLIKSFSEDQGILLDLPEAF